MSKTMFQLAELKECCIWWSWPEKNWGKMDTPSPNRPAKENIELNVQRICSKCLNQKDPNAFTLPSQVMKPGCTLIASLTSGPIRCGWLLMGKDQLSFNQISTVGSDCFPFFPTHRVQSWLTFCHRSQHSLQHTMLKLFYPKWQNQHICSTELLVPVRPFSMIQPVPTRPRSLWPS